MNFSSIFHRAQCAFLSFQTKQKYTYKIFVNPATGEKIHRYILVDRAAASNGKQYVKLMIGTGVSIGIASSIVSILSQQKQEQEQHGI